MAITEKERGWSQPRPSPQGWRPTSLTSEGKLDGIAARATEGVDNEVTATSLCEVLSYLLWCGTEPSLWREGCWLEELQPHRERSMLSPTSVQTDTTVVEGEETITLTPILAELSSWGEMGVWQ